MGAVALVGLIALLVLGSDFLVLDAKRFRIGGSFLGLVLAMALLGPAPAAALGLASALVDARAATCAARTCSTSSDLRDVPAARRPVLDALDDSDPESGGYAIAVFVVFIAANALNFLMIAGHTRLLRGGSLVEMFRTVFMPVLPWELATAS